MKRKLLRLRALLCFGLLLSFFVSSAQINYSENFDVIEDIEWLTTGFDWDDTIVCSGGGTTYVNLYDGWFEGYTGELISPSIGVSNGTEVTVTYQYRILDYAASPSIPTTNDQEWGTFTVYYGTSATGPWSPIDAIDSSNHVESADCVTRTATFTPVGGSQIYLRVYAELSNFESDFLIFFDEVTAVQEAASACAGTPAPSVTVASSATICTSKPVTLSLDPYYAFTGMAFQWQTSADGVTYTNVATGGTGDTYSAIQATATWYRASVSCIAGGTAVLSTPVQVQSTGAPCYCDVDFYNTVEPITSVEFAGINNQSPADTTSSEDMEDFTALAPAQVSQGQSYPIALKGNTNGSFTNYFTVFFDWNKNGDFSDDGEVYQIGTIVDSDGTDGQVAQGTIAVPANAPVGVTRMRVFKSYNAATTSPCSAADATGYGQVEDYYVNVTAAAPVAQLTWVNLQSPATLSINQGETGTVYARAYGQGITEAAGAGAGVSAWIGISTTNTDPSAWTTWVPATFNVQAGNNDEFSAAIGATLTPGTYYYASRFQLNTGAYLYGGYTADGGGIWSTTNVSGVLTVNCNVAVPTVDPLAYCAGITGAELPVAGGLKWYFGPTGDNAIPADTLLTTGTFFVSKIEGTCESATRTPVVITVSSVIAPEFDDLRECDSYTLPALQTGNYYTATGGTGTQLAAGTEITQTAVIYVYAVAAANPDCTSESSFTVTINSAGSINGDASQSLVTGSTVEDIEIEANAAATIIWYSDEALTTVVSSQTVLVDGATYYAVQTLADCSSAAFAVTITLTLGLDDFGKESFAYYPNPVDDVLTLSYTKSISGVQVHNLLGQLVLEKKTLNATQAQLSLGSLTAGTYMVKVVAEDGAAKTIKVIKK